MKENLDREKKQSNNLELDAICLYQREVSNSCFGARTSGPKRSEGAHLKIHTVARENILGSVPVRHGQI